MDIVLNLFLFVIGLVILYFGAEGTLNGSVRIATAFGVSKLVIGLTLVSFGTSAPELVLDVTAAMKGSTDLAFGNLIGSNISNLAMILAIGAIIRPLTMQMNLLSAEVPMMIGAALLTWSLASDGLLDRGDGLMLLACLVLFVGYTLRSLTMESSEVKSDLEAAAETKINLTGSFVLVVVGLCGLVLGANLMVMGATGIARMLGISELLIGLTIVAIGTTSPELAATIAAARKGEADIVVGNAVGSNIFNLLGVLACVACVADVPVAKSTLSFELPYMSGLSLLMVPIMIRGKRITRGEGFFLISLYAVFLVLQVILHGSPSTPHA